MKYYGPHEIRDKILEGIVNCFKSLNFLYLVIFGLMGVGVSLGCSASSSEEENDRSPGSPVKCTLSSPSSASSSSEDESSRWQIDSEGRPYRGEEPIDLKRLKKNLPQFSTNGAFFSLRSQVVKEMTTQ